MKYLVIILLATLAGCGCLQFTSNQQPAAANQFPHQVSLRFPATAVVARPTVCGGSIISASWVLTAASCLVDRSQIILRFGTTHLNAGGLAQIGHRHIRHPRFQPHSPLLPNNIALVAIPAPLRFGPAIRPIRLPAPAEAQRPLVGGRAVTVTGWGATWSGVGGNAGVETWLHWSQLRTIENAQCVRRLEQPIAADVVCTVAMLAGGNWGPCAADVGGPVVMEAAAGGGGAVQVAIVSFVAPNWRGGCTAGLPAGHTRTASHMTWIRQHTGLEVQAN